MPLNLNHVHQFAAVLGQSQPQIVAEHHYVRLKGEGAEFPLYIQGGQVYAESGEALEADDLPDWFWAELRKCKPESLAVAGWHAPIEPDGTPASRRRIAQ
jgi:hypothetical protein